MGRADGARAPPGTHAANVSNFAISSFYAASRRAGLLRRRTSRCVAAPARVDGTLQLSREGAERRLGIRTHNACNMLCHPAMVYCHVVYGCRGERHYGGIGGIKA